MKVVKIGPRIARAETQKRRKSDAEVAAMIRARLWLVVEHLVATPGYAADPDIRELVEPIVQALNARIASLR